MDTISIYRTIEKKIKVEDLLQTAIGAPPSFSYSTKAEYDELFQKVKSLIREYRSELFGTYSNYQMTCNGYNVIKHITIEGKKVSGREIIKKLVQILKNKK